MSSISQRILEARQQALAGPAVVVETLAVTIQKGGTAQARIKLAGAPPRDVTLSVTRASGDAGVAVASGGQPSFSTTDWDTWRTIDLTATSGAAGQYVFQVSGAWVTTGSFTVTAQEVVKQVVIDPVSRIEGRLRMEVELTGSTVSGCWSTSALFRGVEPLLAGRAPQDAPLITQRVCGVCTYVHGACSVEALEDAAGVALPDNARVVRNLLLGAQFLHDHIVHFYHLQGLDWIDIPASLNADAAATEALAQAVTPAARDMDFAAAQARLQGLANTGNLGLFAGGHFGHPGYRFSAEENLLLATHYLEALKVQVSAARMMAVLGGKNPHPAAMVPGGVTCGGELAKGRLAAFNTYLADVRDFVDTVLAPDAVLLAMRHPEYADLGGSPNHLVYGGFPLSVGADREFFFPAGVLLQGDVNTLHPVDLDGIAEDVARAWYSGTALHPAAGRTEPNYTGMDRQGRYSWSKAPRYQGLPMEVGPLSRLLVSLAAGHAGMTAVANDFLRQLGWSRSKLNSAMGRIASRALEARVIAQVMGEWSAQLATRIAAGDDLLYVDWSMPAGSSGVGYGEAPRGALGHWLQVADDGTIGNYQMVVPSTWNFGPRDAAGQPGPVERAMVGLTLADADRPLEVLRMVHSFDPCIACGVHCIVREPAAPAQPADNDC